ncbi:hypothetical protein LTR72_002242 [Exophiala xenobiotica]|uniref:Uncharacterized protein n=1 Tax=Vermiconidia calcicola TaxID=1690605 RepID=A0AAV9Q0M2_9PEZI|nr:hypothetical protein LTR72_002242 [Exophiala xenobiotica]KAK5530655.1 hypothetical protein LTR23_010316 [Chaetothyriales sp. CCFEE 6169]KAK5530818.1 hypothetical protein LTR25_008675 [Vermiconidia calcicola]KAK5325513.1 hypothetical protein LTR93_003733 [Exophiala xenobiotica]KAK5349703.1 hypothetical protein LTR61_006409 [Exophiala xenobiotica]
MGPDSEDANSQNYTEMFEFLDTVDRGLPSERTKNGIPVRPSVSLPTSRNNSTTSIDSLRSEPGWMTSMKNDASRSRANSATSQTSNKPSSGFSRFFKSKKDKKDPEQVITSQHAAAVRAKLARDSRFDKYRKAVANKDKKGSTPRVVGILNTQHLTAEQQELRHPHSGPPSRTAAGEQLDMPILARIVSGDEADEADQWERMREEYKESTIPDLQMLQIIEGAGVESGSGSSSGTSTPTPREIDLVMVPESKVIEREGVKLLAVDRALNLRPKPVRRHTPIGGRFTKDEHGIWKK